MAQSRLRAYFRGQAADLKNAGQKQDLSNQPQLHGKAKEKPQASWPIATLGDLKAFARSICTESACQIIEVLAK